jgi:hypothetical protein
MSLGRSDASSAFIGRNLSIRQTVARAWVAPTHFPACAKEQDKMAAELKRYWFVAAVFREPRDLVATIAELRVNAFSRARLLVVANHKSGDTRKALDGAEEGQVAVVSVSADGSSWTAPKLPVELGTLVEAMHAGKRASPDGDGRSQVYAQLRQDVAGGALVLIASVADPDEQLLGARILLRGNCECVLTHEIAVGNA